MEIKIISDIPDMDKNEPIFSDIETQGLYTVTRLAQFYQPTVNKDVVYLVDLAPVDYTIDKYTQNLRKLKDFITSHYTIWYNASYDLGTLNVSPVKFDDVFYAIKSAYPEFQEFNLDKVIAKMGYSYLYKDLDKKSLQKRGFVLGARLSQQQIKYAAIDVIALSYIYNDDKVQNIMKNNLAYKTDIETLRNTLIIQQNGMIVNHTLREQYLKDAEQRCEKYAQLLPAGFNPNSYIQVRKLLNINKSDHATLVRYANSGKPDAKLATYIIELRKAKKQVQYLESINFNKMYTKFNPAGAVTGRFTASGGDLHHGFNSQQIPRQYQDLFTSDTEDTTVVHFDYATLELRLACAIFGISKMYTKFKNDEDIHTATAMAVSGKKFSKEWIKKWEIHPEYVTAIDRQNAKAVNFGFIFGMGAEKFMNYAYTNYGITFTLEQCKEIRNIFMQEYPEAAKYHKYVWEQVNKGTYIYQTALGRRVCPRTGTDGINGPVQGSGAETTKLALNLLIRAYPEAIKYVFNIVHDAIYMRVPKYQKDIWEDRLRKYMLKGWEEISKSSLFKYNDIKMKVD